METVWFAIVSAMLTIYVVLDGFDFGAGILHRFVARTDNERRTVLAAIGPVWDGNEVWLIAAGGVLFMAFPRTYSTAFSGFYLALMIVLWLLILRGAAIAFRSEQENPLWHEFWDTIFSLASALLAVVFGTALGNIVRGVPLDRNGLAAMPLFTSFLPGRYPGIFDCYTTLVGLFTLGLLAGHGALFLAWRTTGTVQERSRLFARRVWWMVIPLWVVVTLATAWIQWDIFARLLHRPWSLLLVVLMLIGIRGIFKFRRDGRDLAAFLSSAAFILGLMAATMAGNYPFWLRSTVAPDHGLTAANTAAASYGLSVALLWFAVGIALAAGYFVNLYRSILGKVGEDANGHGY
jgi:cytochrome d ubiquinol oxidase subunit II